MDLHGFTTVDEVGEEDAQVRNQEESFKPATAAEEIDYLNKILADIERDDVKDNNNGRKRPDFKNCVNSNNSNEEPVTDDVDVCEGNSQKEKYIDCSDIKQLGVINDKLSKNQSDIGIENENFTCKELPSHVDNISTQAHKPQVNLSTDTDLVAREFSIEPNLEVVNTSIPLPVGSIAVGVDQNTLGEGLETHSVGSLSLAVLNKNGSSELNYCSDAISVPVDCSPEGSSVLESGHYSAGELQNSCLSGQDISGLDISSSEQETTEISASSNIVLGDINSLLTDATEAGSVGTEDSTTKEVPNLSLVKTEPVDADPGEDFALESYFDDPAEEFRVKEEQKIKEEPQECPSPPSAAMDQEPTLFHVKIFKSENEVDNDDEALTSMRYIVEKDRQYSREQLSAALIISQSSLAPAIDMSMFNSLGKTFLEVKLNNLEEVVLNSAQLVLEDSRVVNLFVEKYGKSLSEWKKIFPVPKKRGRKKQQSSDTAPDTGKRKCGRRPKRVTHACDVKQDTDTHNENQKHDVPIQALKREGSINDRKIKVTTEYSSGQGDATPKSDNTLKRKPGRPKKVITKVNQNQEEKCKMDIQIPVNTNECNDRKKMGDIQSESALSTGVQSRKVKEIEKRKPGRPKKTDKHGTKVLEPKNNCENTGPHGDDKTLKHLTPVIKNENSHKEAVVTELGKDESVSPIKSESDFEGFSDKSGSPTKDDKLQRPKKKGKRKKVDFLPDGLNLQTTELEAGSNEVKRMASKTDIISPKDESEVISEVFDTKAEIKVTGKSVIRMETAGHKTSNHQSKSSEDLPCLYADDSKKVVGTVKQNGKTVVCAEINKIERDIKRENISVAECTGKKDNHTSLSPLSTCCRPCSVYLLDIAKDKKYKKVVRRQLRKLMKKIKGSQIMKSSEAMQPATFKGYTVKETSGGVEQAALETSICHGGNIKKNDPKVSANANTSVSLESSAVLREENHTIIKEDEKESAKVPRKENHGILKVEKESAETPVENNVFKEEEVAEVVSEKNILEEEVSVEVVMEDYSSLKGAVTNDSVGKQDVNEEVGMLAAQDDSSDDRGLSDSDDSEDGKRSFGIGLALAYLKEKNSNKNTLNEGEESKKSEEKCGRSYEDTEHKKNKSENLKEKKILPEPDPKRRKSANEDQGRCPINKNINVATSNQSRSSLSSFRIPKKTVCKPPESLSREESPIIKKRVNNLAPKKSSGYVSDRHREIEGRDKKYKNKNDTGSRKYRDANRSDNAPHSSVVEGWRAKVNSSDTRFVSQQVTYHGRDSSQRQYSHPSPSQCFASEPYSHSMYSVQNCSSTGNTYKDNMLGMCGSNTSETCVKAAPGMHRNTSGPYSCNTRVLSDSNTAMIGSPGLCHEDSSRIPVVIDSAPCYRETFVNMQQKAPELVETEYSMKQMNLVWPTNVPPPPIIENWNVGVPSSNLTETGKTSSISSQSPVPSVGSVGDSGKETMNSNVTEGYDDSIAVESLRTRNTECLVNRKGGCIEKQATNSEKEELEVHDKDKPYGCGDKFQYRHMSRREKFKLYEKRKRYYTIAKMKFMEEKDKNKRKVRFVEYEKRRNEYNHLKCYLYDESQKRKKIEAQKTELESNEVFSIENAAVEIDQKLSNKEILRKAHSLSPKEDYTISAHPESLAGDCDIDDGGEEEGDVPYSPTGSPLHLDEDFPELNVRRTLLGNTSTLEKSVVKSEGPSSSGIPVNTEQMRELIMSVLDTLKSGKSAVSVESDSQDSSHLTSKINTDKSGLSSGNERTSLQQNTGFPTPAVAVPSPVHPSVDSSPVLPPVAAAPVLPPVTASPVLAPVAASPVLPSVAASPVLPAVTIPSSAPVLPLPPVGISLVPVPSPFTPKSKLTNLQSPNLQPSPVSSPVLDNIQTPPGLSLGIAPVLSSASSIPVSVSAKEKSTVCNENTSEIPLAVRLEWEKDLESVINPECSVPPVLPADLRAFVPPLPPEEKPPLPPKEKPPLPPEEKPPLPSLEGGSVNSSQCWSVAERSNQNKDVDCVDNVMEVPMELDSDDEMAADVISDKKGNNNVATNIVHPNKEGNKNLVVDIVHTLRQGGDYMAVDTKHPEKHGNENTCIGADVHPHNLSNYTGIGVHHNIQKTKDLVAGVHPTNQGNDTFLASFGIEVPSVAESRTTKNHDGRSDLKDIISRLMGRRKHSSDVKGITDTHQKMNAKNQNESGNPKPKIHGFTGILNALGLQSKTVDDKAAPAVKGTPDTSQENILKSSKASFPAALKPDKDDSTDIQIVESREPIEIIESKEPKKLFCVDELLQSVEAADQPGELEVVYADIRRHSSEGKTRDDVPKYYQKIPLAQTLVDKCKDLPLLGLQYVLEVRQMADMTLDTCYYICVICSKKMSSNTLVAHVKSVPHRLKFSEIHCSDIFEKYGKYNLKQWTATLVKDFTKAMIEVEAKMGRHRLAVGYEKDMSSVLAAIKQKINEITDLSSRSNEKKNLGKEVVTSKSSTNDNAPPSQPTQPVQPVTKPVSLGKSLLNLCEVPLPSSAPPPKRAPSAGQGADSAKPSEKTDQSSSVHQKGTGEKTANTNDEVIVIASPKGENEGQFTKSDSLGSKFQKRNYRARSHSEQRSPTPTQTTTPSSPRKKKSRSPASRKSRSPVHRRSRSPASSSRRRRTKSPSSRKSSPSSKRIKHGRRTPSPASRKRKRHSLSRSRSRSRGPRGNRHRSRSRSPHRRSNRSRRTPDEDSEEYRARRKLREFREAEARLKKRHAHLQKEFEKDPESHPKYRREWKSFWERRCQELQNEGCDPSRYDFKPEWAAFWHHRMKFLVDDDYKTRRDDVLRKLKIDDPDLPSRDVAPALSGNEFKKVDGQDRDVIGRIDRSPSPWEGNEGIKAKNPSPPKEVLKDKSLPETDTSSLAKIYEEQFSVIGTLKLLNELEDQLGSFGPAMTTLLDKAIECSQKGGDPMELFKDLDNMVLVKYAREKLSSQISAGILGATALVRTQMAVERAMWLQSQAEKFNKGGKYLGLDIASIARETLGKDTVQIANFIAQHLLQVGKPDASEEDLQNILFAVSAAHTKMIVEKATKPTQNIVPNVAGSVPHVQPSPTINSPAAVAVHNEPPPPQTSQGSKQPLFPASAASSFKEAEKDPADSEKEESKEDGPSVSGLSLLQNAYEDDSVDMDKLSLDDLKSLLANFRSLSNEEQEALTKYLKKLEATDSKKVTKLREEMQKTAKNASAANKARTLANSKPSITQGNSVVNPSSKRAMQHSGNEKGLPQVHNSGRDGTPAANQLVNTETNVQAGGFSVNLEPPRDQKPPSPIKPKEMQPRVDPMLGQTGKYIGNNHPNSEVLPQEREGEGFPEQRNLPESRPDQNRIELQHGDNDERINKPEGFSDVQGFGKPMDERKDGMQDYGNPRDDQRRGEFQGFGNMRDDQRRGEFQRFGNPWDDQRSEFQGLGNPMGDERRGEFQRFGNTRDTERRGEFERFGNPRDNERMGDWQGFGNSRFDDRRGDWQGFGNPRFDDRRGDWQGYGNPREDDRRNHFGPDTNRPGPPRQQAQFMPQPTSGNRYDPRHNQNEPGGAPHMGPENSFGGRPGMVPPGAYQSYRGSW